MALKKPSRWGLYHLVLVRTAPAIVWTEWSFALSLQTFRQIFASGILGVQVALLMVLSAETLAIQIADTLVVVISV
jgi:hypothetical protein